MNPTGPQPSRFRLVIAMCIVTVLAVGIAVFEFSSAQKSEESLAAANRLHQSDMARQQELAEKAAATERARTQLNAQLMEQRTAAEAARAALAAQNGRPVPAAAPGGTAADAFRNKAREDGRAFLAMFGDQAKPALMTLGRAQFERSFSNLIRSGMLTPAQIEELETATCEQWIDTMEVTPDGGYHPGNPNLTDDQLRNLLGNDGFASLQEARRLQPLQFAVNDISSMSVFVPFTPEQSKQLLQVVASASSAYQSGGKGTPQSIDWNQVLAQSHSFLSEPQLNAVKAEAQFPQLTTLVKQFYQAQPQPPQSPPK